MTPDILRSGELITPEDGAWFVGMRIGGASQLNPRHDSYIAADGKPHYYFYPCVKVRERKFPDRLNNLIPRFGGEIVDDGTLWSVDRNSPKLLDLMISVQRCMPWPVVKIDQMVAALRGDGETFRLCRSEEYRQLYSISRADLIVGYARLAKNKAVAAGFFDGCMEEPQVKSNGRLRLRACSADLLLLKGFKSEYGGTIQLHKLAGTEIKVDGETRKRPSNLYNWVLNDDETKAFWVHIRQFVILKTDTVLNKIA